mgnify:CR=1 FL=1
MKSLCLLLFSLTCFTLYSCKKNKADNTIVTLAGTRWTISLIVENEATNPPGANGSNVYYPWLDCNKEDTYTFSDGQLKYDSHGVECSSGRLFEASSEFTYDLNTKNLTIKSGNLIKTFQGLELTKDRLKLCQPTPLTTTNGYMIYLFKKK